MQMEESYLERQCKKVRNMEQKAMAVAEDNKTRK
jgi:hypothetical protein